MAQPITLDSFGRLIVPDHPVIPFIEGDGIGKDIWPAARIVFDAAVMAVFGSEKKIKWLEILAGEKGFEQTGQWLPDSALETIKSHCIAIKGPLATPVGKGIRSLNVRIRQSLDLYACIRPIRYYPPVPNPVNCPENVDIVVFRENTEDLYAGIEWESGSKEAIKLLGFLKNELGCDLPASCSLGIKPISPEKTKRLVIRAVEYALENNRKSVTLMHKGNIMKFTEGGFRKWGYEAAFENFGDRVITEDRLYELYEGLVPDGMVVIKDRIADMVFAQVLIRPEEFDIIACPNLNGDYVSDALAAQVGGLGISPGANIGETCAVFEATHGTAPDIAGKDIANPCSIILSGAMMFDHMGWQRVGDMIRTGVSAALSSGMLTRDLASGVKGGKRGVMLGIFKDYCQKHSDFAVKLFFKSFQTLIFPYKCLKCRAYIDSAGVEPATLAECFCPSCLASGFKLFKQPFCSRCGHLFEQECENHLCETCLRTEPGINQVRAALVYQGIIKEAVPLFKYQSRLALCRVFEKFLFSAYERFFLESDTDIILPIPLHGRRLRMRGFNQAYLLVRNFSRNYEGKYGQKPSWKIHTGCLERIRHTSPQTGYDISQRKKNLKNAFKIRDRISVKNKKILLVDDVYTTGATCAEAAKVLLEQGAARVDVLVLARA